MEQIIKEIVILLGGWTVFITAIIGFIANLTTQKILNKWNLKNQQDLEILRNNKLETQMLLKDTSAPIFTSQSLLQERRVEAVDKLWKTILVSKKYFSSVTTFFGLVLPSEYRTALDNKVVSAGLSKVDDNYIENCPPIVFELENYRPYLGETLWLYFFVYRAILGRLSILINWLKEGKDIGDWRLDDGIQHHLRAVFDEEEFDNLLKMSPLDIYYALNILDGKILKEASIILSGQKSSLESFENSKKLRELLLKEKM